MDGPAVWVSAPQTAQQQPKRPVKPSMRNLHARFHFNPFLQQMLHTCLVHFCRPQKLVSKRTAQHIIIDFHCAFCQKQLLFRQHISVIMQPIRRKTDNHISTRKPRIPNLFLLI